MGVPPCYIITTRKFGRNLGAEWNRWRLRKAFYAKEQTPFGEKTRRVYLNEELATEATEKKGGPYILCNVTLVTKFFDEISLKFHRMIIKPILTNQAILHSYSHLCTVDRSLLDIRRVGKWKYVKFP